MNFIRSLPVARNFFWQQYNLITYVNVGEHGEAPGAHQGKHQAHKDPDPQTWARQIC